MAIEAAQRFCAADLMQRRRREADDCDHAPCVVEGRLHTTGGIVDEV